VNNRGGEADMGRGAGCGGGGAHEGMMWTWFSMALHGNGGFLKHVSDSLVFIAKIMCAPSALHEPEAP